MNVNKVYRFIILFGRSLFKYLSCLIAVRVPKTNICTKSRPRILSTNTKYNNSLPTKNYLIKSINQKVSLNWKNQSMSKSIKCTVKKQTNLLIHSSLLQLLALANLMILGIIINGNAFLRLLSIQNCLMVWYSHQILLLVLLRNVIFSLHSLLLLSKMIEFIEYLKSNNITQ